jgi:hypothetical protein
MNSSLDELLSGIPSIGELKNVEKGIAEKISQSINLRSKAS